MPTRHPARDDAADALLSRGPPAPPVERRATSAEQVVPPVRRALPQ